MSRAFEGAAALVTGGASGIGAAVVRRLTDQGARVAVLDLSDAHGPEALAVRCDISIEDEVVRAVHDVVEAVGVPEVAVLNAGVGGFSPLLKMTAAEWDRVMDVNLRGTFLSLREVGRRMVEAGRGAIVVVTSISGSSAEIGMAHYDASKAALNSLVRVAARELGPRGVTVNAVAPGTTDTPLFGSTAALQGFSERVAARTPLGGIGDPDAVAEAVVAVAALPWVTGQVVAADGGLSLYSPIDPMEGRRS